MVVILLSHRLIPSLLHVLQVIDHVSDIRCGRPPFVRDKSNHLTVVDNNVITMAVLSGYLRLICRRSEGLLHLAPLHGLHHVHVFIFIARRCHLLCLLVQKTAILNLYLDFVRLLLAIQMVEITLLVQTLARCK